MIGNCAVRLAKPIPGETYPVIRYVTMQKNDGGPKLGPLLQSMNNFQRINPGKGSRAF